MPQTTLSNPQDLPRDCIHLLSDDRPRVSAHGQFAKHPCSQTPTIPCAAYRYVKSKSGKPETALRGLAWLNQILTNLLVHVTLRWRTQ
jgi:hypothetical protein